MLHLEEVNGQTVLLWYQHESTVVAILIIIGVRQVVDTHGQCEKFIPDENGIEKRKS
jgi:hypothetical protein